MGAGIWNVITTIEVNISFMQVNNVLKVYLQEKKVMLKYTKYIVLLNYQINIIVLIINCYWVYFHC